MMEKLKVNQSVNVAHPFFKKKNQKKKRHKPSSNNESQSLRCIAFNPNPKRGSSAEGKGLRTEGPFLMNDGTEKKIVKVGHLPTLTL